jgi:hypothetical protein
MAQTTGAITGTAAAVYLKIAGASFIDYSGQAQSVDAVTATRASADAYTFDGANAIILLGKEEPVEVTVNFLYTEVASEIWDVAEAAFQAGSLVEVKWEPKGSTGKEIVTSAGGYITSIVYPAVAANGAGPVVASITVRAPGISTAA